MQDSSSVVSLSESHYHLQLILRTSNDALMKSWRAAILDALGHRGMDQRFMDIKKAHSATFEWLLQDPRQTQETTVGSRNDEHREKANLEFTNWLRSDGGIFHIAGKPGSGKSTLMKFLCQSPKTAGYLEEWRGKDKLVLAKCFFWRHGQEDQKNFIALVRSLLYQVLLNCPELIEVVFPIRWAQIAEHGIRNHLDGSEIQEAFNRMLDSHKIFKGRKFAFFIDALDEYNGRHIDLVNEFVKWSSQHPTDLKICVTSREYNEFILGFSDCPSLRIHDCTRMDISLLVRDKIDALVQRYLSQSNAPIMYSLRRAIASKAEGVFVWVHLVLNAVEDGVLNGDSISDLEDRVKTFPNGLDDLYQHLFDSIPESYRAKAFESLMLTCLLSSASGLHTPLIRYYLLNEVIADPDFAMKMTIREGPVETQKLLQTRRQLYGRCKGLLEVHSSPPCYWRGPDDGVVKFMHSTAQEFLDKPHVKRLIDAEVGHIDFFQRECMTFLATMKYGYPGLGPPDYQAGMSSKEEEHRLNYRDSAYNDLYAREFQFIIERASKEILTRKLPCGHPFNAWFPGFINTLRAVSARRFRAGVRPENHLLLQAPVRNGPLDPVRYTDNPAYIYDMFERLVLLTYGLFDLLESRELESIVEMLHKTSLPKMDIMWILRFLTPPTPDEADSYERLYHMMQLLLATGLSPNTISWKGRGITVFECCICYFLTPSIPCPDVVINPFSLFELFLLHGAKSDLRLVFGPTYQRRGTNIRIVRVAAFSGMGEGIGFVSVYSTAPIVSFAFQRDGFLSVRDLFEFWFPDDYMRLHQLLDRRDTVAGSSSATAATSSPDNHRDSCREYDTGPPAIPCILPGIEGVQLPNSALYDVVEDLPKGIPLEYKRRLGLVPKNSE